MQTTLSIDDDVLAAVETLAQARHQTAGQVLSELAKIALGTEAPLLQGAVRNGILLLPVQPHSRPVTLEMVQELEEELAFAEVLTGCERTAGFD